MSDSLEEQDISEKVANDKVSVNPELVNIIKQNILKTVEENTDVDIFTITYLTVKYFLIHPKIRTSNSSVISAIFVYYLELSRLLSDSEDDQGVLDQSSLKLFDVYLNDPSDFRIRKLLYMVGDSINEIVINANSFSKDVNIKDILEKSCNVTLIVESIKTYTAYKYRKQNLEYITWVKIFLEKCLSDKTLSFMDEDEILDSVLKQIKDKSKVIKV